MTATEYHALEIKKIYKELDTDEKGLSESEAKERLAKYGENKIELETKISKWKIFINQFKNLPVILLIIAAIISIFLGSISKDAEKKQESLFDAILIVLILVANAIFGFWQEYRAEKSIEALKKLTAPLARVLRDNEEMEISINLVVPGDVLILREGDIVPADARVIESISLHVDESALTGESVPVHKEIEELKSETALAERRNMVYMTSTVTRGKGRAIVTATNIHTEIGKIAKEIAEAEEKVTSFQIEVDDIGKKIAIGVGIIIAIIIITELLLHKGELDVIILTAVGLAVAAIPEGLPAVVTLALAIGTNKMAKQNALMRKLATVQNLGAIDIICTDKTGTLTENTMTVTNLFYDGKHMFVTGKGHETKGDFLCADQKCDYKEFELLLRCAVLCNDARVDKESGKFKGDPTEIAVLIPSYKAGYNLDDTRKNHIRIGEVPFSAERKMMSTANEFKGKKYVYLKGAPEIVLSKCNTIYENGKIKKITEKDKQRIIAENNKMANGALRVLGFAYKEGLKKTTEEEMEDDLVFIGLMGMIDPPREGVREAIDDCRSAGIRVVMITGDNRLTAEAIGKELGFGGESINGDGLDKLSNGDLQKLVEEVDIYARTSPKHKAMILKALKENDHVVAMTGDGVNDAPAIKNSDVGIAMGIRGTEVAKEASDMILVDDNFISIRNAIEQGRGISDNIKKFVNYLLGANLSEVLVIFIASIIGLGFPVTVAQLLWINLLTDGLPALALGVDPPAKDIMKRKPVSKNYRIINSHSVYFMFSLGVAATIPILFVFSVNLNDILKAQSIVFTLFVVKEMVKVELVRSYYHTDISANKWLTVAIVSSLLLQLIVLYTPLNEFFKTKPLGFADWLTITQSVLLFLVLHTIFMKIGNAIIFKREKDWQLSGDSTVRV